MPSSSAIWGHTSKCWSTSIKFSSHSVFFRFLGNELFRRLKNNDTFPDLRIHIIDIDPIVGQYRDIIDQVSPEHAQSQLQWYSRGLMSQMKPLFSKKAKEVYHPGDPRRKAFEEQLRRVGRNPEELEGQTIEVENDAVVKVSFLLHSFVAKPRFCSIIRAKCASIWNKNNLQYSHDLFYIAPFYHEAFPNLGHLIATDLDIEFRC